MKNEKSSGGFKAGFKKLFGSSKSKEQKIASSSESLVQESGKAGDLKVGIIGAGRMGITHFSIINGLDGVKVVAIADTSSQLLSMFDKYVNVNTYNDWAQLIENDDVDALLVCTPPSINKSILEKAAEKNLHVFIEKPFMMNYEDANYAADLFEGKNLINQVGYVNRNNAMFMKLRELVKSQKLGKAIRFKTEMYSATVVKPESGGGWRSNAKSGGGATFEMATHAIDLSVYLFGAPSVVSGSAFSSVFSINVEDIVSSTFRYSDGLVGSLFVNWSDKSYRKPANIIEITFQNGKVIADQYELKVFCNDDVDDDLSKGWTTFSITDLFYNVPFYVRGNEFTKQLDDFVRSISSGKMESGQCTFSEAAETLRVVDLMRDDAESVKQ